MVRKQGTLFLTIPKRRDRNGEKAVMENEACSCEFSSVLQH